MPEKYIYAWDSVEEWLEWYKTWSFRVFEPTITEEQMSLAIFMLQIDGRFCIGTDGRIYELEWQ